MALLPVMLRGFNCWLRLAALHPQGGLDAPSITGCWAFFSTVVTLEACPFVSPGADASLNACVSSHLCESLFFKATWTIQHLLPLGFQPQIPGEPKLFPYPI